VPPCGHIIVLEAVSNAGIRTPQTRRCSHSLRLIQ
jgi:hypothetical protein